MMDCRQSRARLLEADLDELSASGEGDLARHLLECAGCRELAESILQQTARLSAALATPPPPLDPELVLRAAETRGRQLRPWVAWAAAAMIAGLMLSGVRDRPLPGERIDSASLSREAYPLVEAPQGRDVAVIPTTDPEITVLWFF